MVELSKRPRLVLIASHGEWVIAVAGIALGLWLADLARRDLRSR